MVPNDEPPPPSPERFSRREERALRTQEWRQPSPERRPLPQLVAPEPKEPKGELVIPSVMNADDVVGIPRRKRLLRDTIPSNNPLPSSRLTRGLWADVQRHLIQAYEYLCHVGEAKEWIEGCLGGELPFGVVELEEQLRNGVILAKLVRVFQGEASVRRIYDVRRESHLLARRGLARRIGNLVGHLQFSDDQLQRTQRGLKEAGVPMPNFGNIGRELAKEINEEPEEEPETEDERRDRLLLECEDSIAELQATARAFLVRKAQATQRARIRMAERYVPKIQAIARAALVRRQLKQDRKQVADLGPWAVALQARARGILVRRQWKQHLRLIRSSIPFVVKVQAQSRGVLQRRKFQKLKAAIRSCKMSVVKLQSMARARIAQRSHKEISKEFARPVVMGNIVALQAHMRGALQRAHIARQRAALARAVSGVVGLQAQVRGVLIRRRVRTQLAKLEDVTDVVVRIQAAVRTYLARKRLLNLIRSLRKATPALVGLQAIARAKLARQQHKEMHHALSEVKVLTAVGGFQARARAALARSRHQEQVKKLEFVEPDVVGFQATARGYLVRFEWYAWRDYIRSSHPQATILQALLRGVLQRRRFREKMAYYRSNLDKIVQIQSLFRAKETREQYRQLTLGTNVTVGTIKNFVHLLDDSEADFQEEIKVERLRQEVVKRIRDNQGLEHDVSELDVKIALVVQNVKNFEELVKAKRRLGTDSAAIHAARASVLAAHGDPFASPSTLDRTAKRKLELYQQLFYVLQTDGKYLTRLFAKLSSMDSWEKNRKLLERVVLTLFGYGQAPREEYLLLKFFQTAVHDEVAAANSVEDIIRSHPSFINVAVHYLRPKQTPFIRETLQGVVREVINADDLDLETDPCVNKFPDTPPEACAACVARLVYYRYINPAIITPETFDIVSTTVDIASRKNLAQISKMLAQITSGAEFGDESPAYIPVNDYVRKSIAQITAWLLQVADVSDAETEFHAHEFLDATIQPRPIWISPNEVYSMHTLLSQQLDHLAPARDDTLRVILTELDGVPNVGNDELNEARDTALELQLSNRFARVKDPGADEKALWVQAKRAVLAILRVQPAKDLVESLMQPVTDEHELVWEGILEDMERDQLRHQRRMPSTTGADSAYRLEDIRSMTFREVKAHAIFFLLELEKQGKITRMDGYQGILNAIAGDVRSKNRRRVQRLHEKESLEESLKHLAERKKYFEEQIRQYHDYVETAMNTMQRGKGKRRLLPFTPQYFHMRELQKAGKMPQFGSYKYTAQRFYDKGILLSIENYSPRQFDKLDIVMSSNAVGIFTIEIFNHTLGITNRMATCDVKMEELLQAQFEDRASFSMFNGLAKFNLNLLLWQINKK
ncbi:Ras GTPase-activating-like protein rng2 [Trametes pubescens]|uniref:Ras GTPase-activating-like protein rng2 n=1 Tax=Trametes pubescens TaxID=154538 RepID=A0A1M2VK55_TRAPU|nr:Ras GTPase-activating-like protein rng2 [Trametes pubescens]